MRVEMSWLGTCAQKLTNPPYWLDRRGETVVRGKIIVPPTLYRINALFLNAVQGCLSKTLTGNQAFTTFLFRQGNKKVKIEKKMVQFLTKPTGIQQQ